MYQDIGFSVAKLAESIAEMENKTIQAKASSVKLQNLDAFKNTENEIIRQRQERKQYNQQLKQKLDVSKKELTNELLNLVQSKVEKKQQVIQAHKQFDYEQINKVNNNFVVDLEQRKIHQKLIDEQERLTRSQYQQRKNQVHEAKQQLKQVGDVQMLNARKIEKFKQFQDSHVHELYLRHKFAQKELSMTLSGSK